VVPEPSEGLDRLGVAVLAARPLDTPLDQVPQRADPVSGVAGFPQPDQLPHVELLNLGPVAQVFQRPFPEPGPLAGTFGRIPQPGVILVQRAPLELRTVDADGLSATPARQQQPGELLTKPVSPVTRRILGQATARPSLRVGAPPRVPEHRDDLAVLPGA